MFQVGYRVQDDQLFGTLYQDVLSLGLLEVLLNLGELLVLLLNDLLQRLYLCVQLIELRLLRFSK